MTHDELEKLCTYLEENDASMEAQREAASELWRMHRVNLGLSARVAHLHAINAELLMALQGLHDDLMDYIKLNNLGAENNHWLVIARAAIANATKGTI